MSLCVGAVYYDAGKMKFYYYGSEGFTEKTVSVQRDVMVFLTYGRQLNKQGTLFAGATVKGANSTIVEKFGAWAFAADLGLLYVSNFGFGAALSLQNLGYSTAFLSRREELPTMVTPSVSYTFVVKTFAISVSGDAGSVIFPQFMFTPAVGLDVTWFRASKPFISISGGYRFGLKDGNLQVGITIYSPFRFIDADLGYSYTHAVYLKPTHRLSLGIRF